MKTTLTLTLLSAFAMTASTANANTAQSYIYSCKAYGQGSQDNEALKLKVQGNKVYDLNKNYGPGTLNTKYKPRSEKMKSYYEYVGFKNNVNSTSMYLEKSLLTGGRQLRTGVGGFLQLRALESGGYFQVEYICFLRR